MPILTISSSSNKKYKEALALKDGKSDFFLVEGYHLVEMAKEYSEIKTIFSIKEYDDPRTILITPSLLKNLSEMKTPEGIIAVVKKKKPLATSSNKALVLDEVRDPGNVGTLLRTALAFNYHDVYLPKGNALAYSSRVISASQGAILALNIIEGDNSLQVVSSLKEQGYTLYGGDLKGYPLKQAPIREGKIALVLGNEARGISKEVLALLDERVFIEMEGIDSLNVGVAGGILMYHL